MGQNRAEASLERAQNLNPMVDVKVDTEDIEKKPESFFTTFDAVRFLVLSLLESQASGSRSGNLSVDSANLSA